MRPLDRPAASAPAEPGSQAPFANGQLRSTKPHPPRKWPIPSPAATPPSSQSSFLRIKWQATNQRGKSESSAVLTQGNRVKKSCGDETCEKFVVPCGNFSFKAQAVFAWGLSDQV